MGVVLFLYWMLTSPIPCVHPTLLGILGKFQEIPVTALPEISCTEFYLITKGKKYTHIKLMYKKQNIDKFVWHNDHFMYSKAVVKQIHLGKKHFTGK